MGLTSQKQCYVWNCKKIATMRVTIDLGNEIIVHFACQEHGDQFGGVSGIKKEKMK